MAAKQLVFDEQARQAILRGVSKLSKAVVATLGPKGRNVVIDKKFGSPTVTKDGVTVAKFDNMCKKVKDKEEIKQVAAFSANWDYDIADKIADAMDNVVKDRTTT